jgi:hypothetical protein
MPVTEVLQRADYVTQAGGGRGAVREVIELILDAQGHWNELMSRFTQATNRANPSRIFNDKLCLLN